MCEKGACERYRRLSNRIDPDSVRDGGRVPWVWRKYRTAALVRRGVPLKSVQRESKCCFT